jgi:hypothetical protein
MAAAAAGYAARGWPVCAGAFPPAIRHQPGRPAEIGRACSCDRLGCPAPAAHPISPAWPVEATADPLIAERRWTRMPEANIILVTGRTFDVLDVPARAGNLALAAMKRSGVTPGPVAISAGDRALFFVATRGAPGDETEWWSCHLDCEPQTVEQVAGLRWHCRNSYVLAPPSRTGSFTVHWLHAPGDGQLPDPLLLLPYLADACEELAQ